MIRVLGARCVSCDYRIAASLPRCPSCGGATEVARFGPRGIVWAATTLHVPVQQRNVPYTLAYVDLADGPRLLVHLSERLPIGSQVMLTGTTASGDIYAVRDDGGNER